MPHELEGLELSFTSRRSWKAFLVRPGVSTITVSVTWGEHMKRRGSETFLPVWFQDLSEMEAIRTSGEAFIVATANAANDPQGDERPIFSHFTGVFRVIATGVLVDANCIETKVLERLRA